MARQIFWLIFVLFFLNSYASEEETEIKPKSSPEEEGTLLGCVFEEDITQCLQRRTMRALNDWLNETKKETAMEVAQNLEKETGQAADPTLMDEISDMISIGMKKLFGVEDEEENQTEQDGQQAKEGGDNDDLEGRGKKKKLLKISKLILIGGLIKSKLMILLLKLQSLIQLKILGAVLLGLGLGFLHLIVSVKSIWARKFHSGGDEEPKKIVHYEKVNHLHHYQHKHFFDHDQHSGWDRAGNINTNKNQPYSAYRPNMKQHEQKIQQEAHEYAANAVRKQIEREISRVDAPPSSHRRHRHT